jgi:hypothetical protein
VTAIMYKDFDGVRKAALAGQATRFEYARHNGSRERTQIEYRDLFAAAGFALTGVHPTAGPQCIVEGRCLPVNDVSRES